MGVWISESEGEVLTDPETGEIIEDRVVEEFSESMLTRFERGETVEQLAESVALDEFLIHVALAVARDNRP